MAQDAAHLPGHLIARCAATRSHLQSTVVDEQQAPTVERIYREYLADRGVKARLHIGFVLRHLRRQLVAALAEDRGEHTFAQHVLLQMIDQRVSALTIG